MRFDQDTDSRYTTAGVGNIVPGAFTPVLATHTKHLSLVAIISVDVDRMHGVSSR